MKLSFVFKVIAVYLCLAVSQVEATTELGDFNEWIDEATPANFNAISGRQRGRNVMETSSEIDDSCDPSKVILADYPQWREEEGYWIGEYSFYGPDGKPNTSTEWPYRYDNYTGFITGNVQCNKYRQRNLFLYPSLEENGEGNSKIFFADQQATTCDGNIVGPYQYGQFTLNTETTLIGRDNALLYQIYIPSSGPAVEDALIQSQLTTLNTLLDGTIQRTRTAQGFFPTGDRQHSSFYRETKVTKKEFYEALEATVEEYNIPLANLGAFDGFGSQTGNSGFEFVKSHLESSFELECDKTGEMTAETERTSSVATGSLRSSNDGGLGFSNDSFD